MDVAYERGVRSVVARRSRRYAAAYTNLVHSSRMTKDAAKDDDTTPTTSFSTFLSFLPSVMIILLLTAKTCECVCVCVCPSARRSPTVPDGDHTSSSGAAEQQRQSPGRFTFK